MKICVAQMRPIKGNIEKNIETHQTFIASAIAHGADMIVFPELSLTGYEPTLAKGLATTQEDERLRVFQTLSDENQITIGIGLPTRGETGILISMVIFQPHQARQTYSKQMLHADELPYFVNGERQIVLTAGETIVAPAICYESLQSEHAASAVEQGANVYVASVAKSANGVAKAFKHYPTIAQKYSIPVLMANCLGPCDDFEGVGQSAIWNQNGVLMGQLDETTEGILLYDTEDETATALVLDMSSAVAGGS